jgi:hypothetical protein
MSEAYCEPKKFYVEMDFPNGNRARIFYTFNLSYGYFNEMPDENAIELYSHVATVDMPSPAAETAFILFNRGSGDEHIALDAAQLRSLSVGDIVYVMDEFWYCAPIGWHRLPPSRLTDQLYQLAVRHEASAAEHRWQKE